MSQPTIFLVAGVQCDPQIGRPDYNLEMINDWSAQARKAGASLVIFPECAVTGYCFNLLEKGLAIVDPFGKPQAAAYNREQMLLAEIPPAGAVAGFS